MTRLRSCQPHFTLGVALMLLLPSCSSEELGPEPESPAYCNALSADACVTPWPSSVYLRADSATKTGYRVAYPEAVMPKNKRGIVVDPSRLNLVDGFSVGVQPIVYFAAGVSDQNLPPFDNIAASLEDQSPIWILEFDSGKRVPFFAELDANTEGSEVPALIIRPQVPLRFNARYVIAIRDALKDKDGAPLHAPDGFRRLRDGLGSNNAALEAQRETITEVVDFLIKHKLKRSELVLAWDFRTSSEEAVTGQLQKMVEQAIAKLPASGPAFSITKATDFDPQQEKELLRLVEGSFEVPTFLVDSSDDALLKLDQRSVPQLNGTQRFPFFVNIPRCVKQAKGPVPIIVFGHGIFASPRQELLSSFHKKLGQRLCMVQVAAHWYGLSEPDITGIIKLVMPDFGKFPRITDRLQQAHVNMQVLVELIKGAALAKDPKLVVDGKQIIDGQEVYYLGISNGAIQGVAFSALSSRIERFVFNVGGGWWTMMIQRSSDFGALNLLMSAMHKSALDRLFIINAFQALWDYTDPVTWAKHPLLAPLAGRQKKRIILQESKDDDQVSNIATRAIVRGLGLVGLEPMVEPVFGVKSQAGPLASAYVQWNVNPKSKPPRTNTPAPKPSDSESAHKIVRTLDSFVAQLEAFFNKDGQVVNTCGGKPCGRD